MFIGIDLGGTNIAAGLVDHTGKIIKSIGMPTNAPRSAQDISKDMIKLSKTLMAYSLDNNHGQVIGVGVGVPGPVDEKLESVHICVNLGWENENLKDLMYDELGVPVLIDNDANLAALAELEVGSFKGAENAVLLTLGTGVGGGIIANGKMYRGSHGLGTEIGHIFLGENFYDCNCGLNGCFETYASATAIIKYTEKLLLEEGDEYSTLRQLSEQGRLSAKSVFDADRAGDPIGIKSINRFVKCLTRGIGSIIILLDPDIISIGGGVSQAGDYLLDRINESLPKYVLMKGMIKTKICLATTGNDAGIIGAAYLPKFELNL